MYGLIHRSVRDMVLAQYGEDRWNRILKAANAGDEHFMSMQSYDDSVVLALIGGACKELGQEPAALLEGFGRHWIADTAKKTYANLMKSYGDNLWDFLENLDFMHDRISTTFPSFRPPAFELERISDHEALLHYVSTRQGLTPFVVGLLKGLAVEFGEVVDIEIKSETQSDAGQRTTFLLKRP
jgi:guanylate cyclase soluble subunit beta